MAEQTKQEPPLVSAEAMIEALKADIADLQDAKTGLRAQLIDARKVGGVFMQALKELAPDHVLFQTNAAQVQSIPQ